MSTPPPSPTRAIVLLAVAGFAGQAMVRSADSLLPQIAADLSVTVGAASIVVTAYAVMHGSVQLVIGPIGDRAGKYRAVAIACALSAVTVALCGLADSLWMLGLARIASGATAAWIVPLSMAFIGDVIPYESRQQVLGRYLSGQMAGQLFGQAAGGVIGDLLGWRSVFFVLGGLYAVAAIGLLRELFVNPLTRAAPVSPIKSRGMLADYAIVLRSPWARLVCIAVFLEAALMFGAFAYIGADLYARFDLSFSSVGLIVGTFAAGGFLYAATVRPLVLRLGQQGLMLYGGAVLGVAYLLLALGLAWWVAPLAVVGTGLGFYMMHNTLQTNATQMAPEARGTAVGLFSAALYLGQAVGVAIAALVIDRSGAPAVFSGAAVLLPLLGVWMAAKLGKFPASRA